MGYPELVTFGISTIIDSGKGGKTMKRSTILSAIGLLCVMASSKAAVIHVPADYSTIQSAVNASEEGDTVLVSAGTYFENVQISHELLLQSVDGPFQTIIDGMAFETSLRIHNTIVDGFTVQNGYGRTGGILATGSSIVKNCWIKENRGRDAGGGVFCAFPGSDVMIVNNLIARNEVFVTVEGGSPVENGYGAGVYVSLECATRLVNNTIIENIAEDYGTAYRGIGGGVYFDFGTSGSVENNIITLNIAGTAAGLQGPQGGLIENNNIWNNTGDQWPYENQLNQDPLFIDGLFGACYLSHIAAGQDADSPCIDFGNNTASALGLDSLTTRIDQVTDVGVADLGYHYPVQQEKMVTRISANQKAYKTGDNILIKLEILNSGTPKSVYLFAILEVSGQYWFWPQWSRDVAFLPETLPEDRITEKSILDFEWPDTPVSGSALIWAAAIDEETFTILGNYDNCYFEF